MVHGILKAKCTLRANVRLTEAVRGRLGVVHETSVDLGIFSWQSIKATGCALTDLGQMTRRPLLRSVKGWSVHEVGSAVGIRLLLSFSLAHTSQLLNTRLALVTTQTQRHELLEV